MNNLEKYKEDYKRLKELGKALQYGFLYEYSEHPKCRKFYNQLDDEMKKYAEKHAFSTHYQAWYNESLRLIKQLMPERLDDFISLYAADKRRKSIDITNYTISDSLRGIELSRIDKKLVEKVYV